jgi:hypothetical protein
VGLTSAFQGGLQASRTVVACGIFRKRWLVREIGSGHPGEGATVQEGGERDRGDVEVPEPQACEQEYCRQVCPERLALYQKSTQGNLLGPRRQRHEDSSILELLSGGLSGKLGASRLRVFERDNH